MTQIKIAQITEKINVRSIKPKGVERLKTKIDQVGYLPEKPVVVAPNGDGETYILIDGNHRIAALEELGRDSVEVLIDETLITEALRLRRARLANEVSETVVPTTFVDDAKLVWRLAKEGMTQTEIGGVLAWGRGKVKNYYALKNISSNAWAIIGTTFDELVPIAESNSVPTNGTVVPFTEGLLRQILPLTPDQQLELVSNLANGGIKKNKFNELALAYRARNDMLTYSMQKLGGLPENYTDTAKEDIYSGAYDRDWKIDHRPKLHKLIQSILEEWEQKSGIQLIHGDFYKEVLSIEENSIDLVLTDPPFGISGYGGATTKGPDIATADFDEDGDWDTKTYEQIENDANTWVKEWSRILKPGGNLISFCDKFLISHLYKLCKQYGLKPKNVILWHKYNAPGAALGRGNLKSDVEFMLWAVKPGASYTFNKIDSAVWDRGTLIKAALCGGNERLKDKKKETLHSTQKPLSVLMPLIEVFSNRGDIILDGFTGVGSTGAAAKELKRKFVGIELNEIYFRAMVERLTDD